MIAPHPHERPLRAAVILVSALFWSGLVLLLWTRLWPDWWPNWESYARGRYAVTLPLSDVLWLAGAAAIVTYVGTWLRKARQAAALMGHAVEIGAEQYPDLHARVKACVKRLGFAETPLAFLFQDRRGTLSYSLRYWGRDYLAFNGELIGTLTEHQGAIDYFIGYELGRLHDPDRRFSWLLIPGRVLPLLGPAYTRAKIYTYDRYGIAACRARVDAALALALLAVGSRRWKSFSVAQYGEQSRRGDIAFTFFELTSSVPYLSRRSAHLRGVATGTGDAKRRHPLAWVGAALVPGIGPLTAGAVIRMLFVFGWIGLLAIAGWYGYQQLARAGLIEPLESRFENKTVPVAPTRESTTRAPVPPPAVAIAADAYEQLDKDLRRLGDVALNRFRKLGGIPCEVGTIPAALDLHFRASRYAFSCDEPTVYTVVEPSEFEAGRAAHLRSYNWKEKKFVTSLPPVPPAGTTESMDDTGLKKPE